MEGSDNLKKVSVLFGVILVILLAVRISLGQDFVVKVIIYFISAFAVVLFAVKSRKKK